jgi:hypothetical protein
MRTLLEFYLKHFGFLYLDPRYRITDSKTGGDAINASLTVTGPVLSWFLTNDRGQMQLSIAPTRLLTPRNWFWVSLIKQHLDDEPEIEYLPIQKEIEWAQNNIQRIEKLFSDTEPLEPACDALRRLRRSNAEKYWGPAKGQT